MTTCRFVPVRLPTSWVWQVLQLIVTNPPRLLAVASNATWPSDSLAPAGVVRSVRVFSWFGFGGNAMLVANCA